MNVSKRLQRLKQRIPSSWLAAGLFTIGLVLFALQPEDPQITHNPDSSDFPQIYMKQVETREFDAEGKLHVELTTPSVALFQMDANAPSVNDYTLIDAPKIVFFNTQDGNPWRLSAAYGRSESNNEVIRLINDVVIQQESPDQGLIRVTTDELRVRSREQFAETDKAVKMRSAKGQIDAIGMDADLAQSRLQLKSQVKAVYDPR